MQKNATEFPILKVSATGNDFLLVDLLKAQNLELWNREFGNRTRSQLALELCDRREGLGADGFVVLDQTPGLAFAWDFYNSDGGSAEMCGNAARAVCLYYQQNYGQSNVEFKSKVGTVHGVVHAPDRIEVGLPKIKEATFNHTTSTGIHYIFVRAGVPHAVVSVESIAELEELTNLALEIKAEEKFKSEGVNVTFVKLVSKNEIESVTYERGVEGFTRACGTGAISAAYSVIQGEENTPVEVRVPGGQLSVVWKAGAPILSGPAKIVAEMHWIKS